MPPALVPPTRSPLANGPAGRGRGPGRPGPRTGPCSPCSAKTAAASSGVRRRWSSCSRSPYQTLPSRHIVGRSTTAPTRAPSPAAHRSTCSGPQARRMVEQVPHHVVPPAGRRDQEVGDVRVGGRRPGVGQHGQRTPAAEAGGGHQDPPVERGHDPERVPGAPTPPLLLGRGDHEMHLPGREGMGHADPDPVGVQDQHVLVVQPPPAGQDLLDPDLETAGGLGRGRRAALLHELPVDDLAELAQTLGVVGLRHRSLRCRVPGRRVR